MTWVLILMTINPTGTPRHTPLILPTPYFEKKACEDRGKEALDGKWILVDGSQNAVWGYMCVRQ